MTHSYAFHYVCQHLVLISDASEKHDHLYEWHFTINGWNCFVDHKSTLNLTIINHNDAKSKELFFSALFFDLIDTMSCETSNNLRD